jgi:hypothetical protein
MTNKAQPIRCSVINCRDSLFFQRLHTVQNYYGLIRMFPEMAYFELTYHYRQSKETT